MPNERNEKLHPPKALCALCHRADRSLQPCCLTGTGDHPRHVLFCDHCIKDILGKSPSVQSTRPPASPTMSEAEKRYETRRQKAFERLGTDHPICACCPETDWRCMELHHLESRDFGKTLIIVCRNCHRKLSDTQKDDPPKCGHPPMTLETIGRFLLGLADLLRRVAGQLKEFGHYLIEQARLQMPNEQPTRS